MTSRLTIAELNQLAPEAFVRALDGIWERAPWVAQAVVPLRPFATEDALHAAMLEQISALDAASWLAFLNQHPELAGTEAQSGEMTPQSTAEQGALSLTTLNVEEAFTWAELNRLYRQRFGHPFIICLRHQTRATALTAFQTRLSASAAAEAITTLKEIGWIAHLRLSDLLHQQ